METLSQSGAVHREISARDRLIVALDFEDRGSALGLVRTLGEAASFYKVGYRLFFSEGLPILDELRAMGKRVFLDLKLDDIPETIQYATGVVAGKAAFLTLAGGAGTARAAFAGRGDHEEPKLLGVPVLSSLGEEDLRALVPGSEASGPGFLIRYLLGRSRQALGAGCDGLIASGSAIREVREAFGPEILIVSPGIRPSGSSSDEHKRSATPREAILMGADHLVVGRPIYQSDDPTGVARAIIDEIEMALREPGGG